MSQHTVEDRVDPSLKVHVVVIGTIRLPIRLTPLDLSSLPGSENSPTRVGS
jgi:hypothetical protein